MNGVAKITVAGQEVVLKFGLPAVRRIMEKMVQYAGELVDVDEATKAETYNDLGLSHVLYAGYLNGCMMKDLPPSIPFENFYTLLEECANDKVIASGVIAAIACFEESKIVKESISKLKETVEKKSPSIGMKSNPLLSENSDSLRQNTTEQLGGNMY